MASPGKSGSVFFLSGDDRFMIKTVSHEEMLLLLKLIPAYYRHCVEHPATLLTRFYGVHRIKSITKGGSKVTSASACGHRLNALFVGKTSLVVLYQVPIAVSTDMHASEASDTPLS